MPSAKTPAAKKKPAGTAPAAKKKTAARPAARDNALTLLAQDHKEVSKLFKTYEKLAKAEADAEERGAIAQQICEMLTAHATIEEELFYPALRDAIDGEDLLDEAEVEHASVKDLIAQIEGMDPDDDLYDAKVTVLGEYVEHHVEEEENEIFPKASKSKLDLDGLGEQLKMRKEELLAETEAA